MMRDLINIIENLQNDMRDARMVFDDWMNAMENTQFQIRNGFDVTRYFEKPELTEVPVEKCYIFHDWGRRVSDEQLNNPIIVMARPDGNYQVLDGQHRVIRLKENNVPTVKAYVITLPWKFSVKAYGRRNYVLDGKDS
jgi:hypothetical protein